MTVARLLIAFSVAMGILYGYMLVMSPEQPLPTSPTPPTTTTKNTTGNRTTTALARFLRWVDDDHMELNNSTQKEPLDAIPNIEVDVFDLDYYDDINL